MESRERMLSSAEFADRIGVTPARVTQLLLSDEVPGAWKTDCCRRWRIPESLVDRWSGPSMLSVPEFASAIGVQRDTAALMLRDGMVPGAVRVGKGGRWRVPPAAVALFARGGVDAQDVEERELPQWDRGSVGLGSVTELS